MKSKTDKKMPKPGLEDVLAVAGVGGIGYGTWVVAGTGVAAIVVGAILLTGAVTMARGSRPPRREGRS